MGTTIGTFKARAVDGDFGISSTQKEQVAVEFAIIDGDYKGSRYTWYGYFNTTDNAKRALKSLAAAGAAGIYDDPTDLTGLGSTDCEVVLEEDEYTAPGQATSKKTIKIAWVNEVGGGVRLGTRMDEAQRAAFKAKLQGTALAAKPANAPVRVAPAQAKAAMNGPATGKLPNEAGVGADGLPF